MKIFLLLSACLALWQTTLYSADLPEKLVIHVGDEKSIKLPEAIRVHVTRKGIVHLIHDHDEYWSLTGLRTGVVAIESKLKSSDISTLYVDVQPRPDHPKLGKLNKDKELQKNLDCIPESNDHQFNTHLTIELADDNEVTNEGIDSEIKFSLHLNTTKSSIDMQGNPKHSKYKRHILGDPIFTTRPCQDVIIRTGGEDQIETKSDDGRISSIWKNHGLDIKMKLIPSTSNKLIVPFSVSLRTPTKGKSSYGLSDVSSSINVNLGAKILAAVINLSSYVTSNREPLFITNIPIIGPWFRERDESKSSSKLLVWFQIDQNSDE